MVEMAVVLPVFLLVLFGIVEFGRAMMVEQLLANGARLGARRAILNDKTNSEVEQLVRDFCQGVHPTANFTITISVNGVSGAQLVDAAQGDLCGVQVEVPFTQVSLLPSPDWLSTATLRNACTMEHE